MNRVLIGRRANDDMREIWLHIAADNIAAADSLIAEFDAKFLLLADSPQIGHVRTDLPQGLRCFPVWNYLIVYGFSANEISIIRVLHGARQLRGMI
jgi:toxin ParE1/3/4